MKYEQLIAEFSKETGLDVAPDSQGTLWMEADDVPVTIQNRQEQNDVVMFTLPIGEMALDESIMRHALELSAVGLGTDGFFIGISGGALTLSAVLTLDGLDAETFGKKMLALAAASRKVAKRIGAAVAEDCIDRHDAESDLTEIRSNQSMFRV